MTNSQRYRLEGALVALAERGVVLTIGSAEFTALVEPILPEQGQYAPASNEREMSRVNVLREGLSSRFGYAPDTTEVGSIFTDDSTGNTHRVAEIADHPTDIWVKFVCETAIPSST